MEQKTTSKQQPGPVQSIIVLTLTGAFIWFFAYLVVPSVKQSTDEILLSFGVDLHGDRIARVKDDISRTANANASEIIQFNNADFAGEWVSMTSAQRDARHEKMNGKFLELNNLVHDVTRTTKFSEAGYAKFEVSFSRFPGRPIKCDFLVTSANQEMKILSWVAGDDIKFRGRYRSFSGDGLQMEQCIVVR